MLLAGDDALGALTALRHAWITWQEMDAPYESARVRLQLGLALQRQGDDEAARMEFDAASRTFRELGAAPDLALAARESRRITAEPAGGLTARQAQVLRLLANGKTNKAIAAELFISEKTVARHVSDIFGRLGLSSRAAATAYAYEHDLV
jgi:DNA-binding NarL/FixJ family response regulator